MGEFKIRWTMYKKKIKNNQPAIKWHPKEEGMITILWTEKNNSMNNIFDKIVCYFKILIKCEHSQY